MRTRSFLQTACVLGLLTWGGALTWDVFAQAPPKPSATTEETLQWQIILLKLRLAQALSSVAKCEAEGSQAVSLTQDAQTAGQALLKALESRGLTINGAQQIVPKPSADPNPPDATSSPDGRR